MLAYRLICIPMLILLLCLLSSPRPAAAGAAVAARDPRQQAHLAVAVSAARAREASAYVSHLSSSGGGGGETPRGSEGPSPFQDCAGMMARSAERLQRAAGEMRRLGRGGRPEYRLQVSNVKTWVSSALTDQDMCLDSLLGAEGGGLKETVRVKVAAVRQATSNALSLVNRMN